MANFTTSADLLDDALDRAGEPTDGTSDFNSAAIRHLNRAYQGIWKGGSSLDPNIDEVWWWLRKDDQGVLTLTPKVSTGTVSVTNNSAAITFSSGPTVSQAGNHFKVDDHADVFIISAHTADATSATLESVYTGTTDGTANFKSVKLDYDLASDLLYLTSPFTVYQASRQEIIGIDLGELKRKWPLNLVSQGVPRNFAMIGQRKVRFSHYGGADSTDLIKTDYEYIYEPSDLADDTNEPLVPREYRQILSDWTAGLIQIDKSDAKAADSMGLARNGLKAMSNEHRRRMDRFGGDNFGKIFPRQGSKYFSEKGFIRTESGLILG